MTRTVHCRKYKEDLPGLAVPPMPGAVGLELFETTSKQAWDEWLQHQTRLINEKRLNLMDKAHRKYLTEQMMAFLDGENYDQADGYIPDSE